MYTFIFKINVLEIVFMKHAAPNHMLVHKDSAPFKQDNGHLKF